MTFFWLVAGLAGALMLGALAAPLIWRRAGQISAPSAAHDEQIYRDQMTEIDRDLARGALSPEEAEQSRAEIGRRLIAAAEAAERTAGAGRAPAPVSWMLTLVLALGLGLGGRELYLWLGRPGYGDVSLKARVAASDAWRGSRPGQAEAEAEVAASATASGPGPDPDHLDLVERLRTVLAGRPDDLKGHRLLAENLGQLGQWADAVAAQRDVLRIAGADAAGSDYVDLAEYMILAAGGYVSPEAEAVLVKGLERDPREPRGRYYSGLALWQADRPDLAYGIWMQLWNDGPPNAPWIAALAEQLPQVAQAAGRRPPETPPGGTVAPGLGGPGAADIAAAQAMPDEDRQAMIAGMVEGLETRLFDGGGSAEEWIRLVRSLGVLGEAERARAAYEKGQVALAGDPGGLAGLTEAAKAAGLTE